MRWLKFEFEVIVSCWFSLWLILNDLWQFFILKADFHSPILARARLFAIDILQSHGAYQITFKLHLRKTRALKCSHLLSNRNVFLLSEWLAAFAAEIS